VLNELVTDIMADFTDEDGEALVPSEYVERAAERVLPLVSADLDVDYELSEGEVSPVMPGDHRELWLLRSKIQVCRHLRAQAASRVSFSSGDKKMDRSREAANWAALEKDMGSEYASRVKRINPATDDTVLKTDVVPLVYSRGSQTPGME